MLLGYSHLYLQVVSKTKRLGGGFGGKETRSIFVHCAAAVPAHILKRPVKMTLDRDEDMQMTGEMCDRRGRCVMQVKMCHGEMRDREVKRVSGRRGV
jgi:xanthine dehydrogenase molybdopterin-binding subunit B